VEEEEEGVEEEEEEEKERGSEEGEGGEEQTRSIQNKEAKVGSLVGREGEDALRRGPVWRFEGMPLYLRLSTKDGLAVWTERNVCGPFAPSDTISAVKEAVYKQWRGRHEGWRSGYDMRAPLPQEQILFIREQCANDKLRLKDYIEEKSWNSVVDIQLVCKVDPGPPLASTHASHSDEKDAAAPILAAGDEEISDDIEHFLDGGEQSASSHERRPRRHRAKGQTPQAGPKKDSSIFCTSCQRRLPQKAFNKTQRRRRNPKCEDCQRRGKEIRKDSEHLIVSAANEHRTVEAMFAFIRENFDAFSKLKRKARNAILRNFTQSEVAEMDNMVYRWQLLVPEFKVLDAQLSSPENRYVGTIRLYHEGLQRRPPHVFASGLRVEVAFAQTPQGSEARREPVKRLLSYLLGSVWENVPFSVAEICAEYLYNMPLPPKRLLSIGIGERGSLITVPEKHPGIFAERVHVKSTDGKLRQSDFFCLLAFCAGLKMYVWNLKERPKASTVNLPILFPPTTLRGISKISLSPSRRFVVVGGSECGFQVYDLRLSRISNLGGSVKVQRTRRILWDEGSNGWDAVDIPDSLLTDSGRLCYHTKPLKGKEREFGSWELKK